MCSYTDNAVTLNRMLEYAICAGLSDKIISDINPLPQMDFKDGLWGGYYKAILFGLAGYYREGTLVLCDVRGNLDKNNYTRACLIAFLWRYQFNDMNTAQRLTVSVQDKVEKYDINPVGLTLSAILSELLLGDKEMAIAMLERHDSFYQNTQDEGGLWKLTSSIPVWSYLYDDRDRIADIIKSAVRSTKCVYLLSILESHCHLYIGDDKLTDRILFQMKMLCHRDMAGDMAGEAILAEEAFKIGAAEYYAGKYN